ncbi:MAG: hypothetical protein ACOC1P_03250 [Minisyncoccales bacterium]
MTNEARLKMINNGKPSSSRAYYYICFTYPVRDPGYNNGKRFISAIGHRVRDLKSLYSFLEESFNSHEIKEINIEGYLREEYKKELEIFLKNRGINFKRI